VIIKLKSKIMKLLVLFIATISIALSSCVSKKKFINEQSKVSYLQSDSLKHIKVSKIVILT